MLAEQIQKYPKDFQLIIKDPLYTLWIDVHKLVLKSQSPFFDRVLCGANSFTYLWKVDNIRDAQNVIRLFYDQNVEITSAMSDLLAKLECIQFFRRPVDETLEILLSLKHQKRKRGRPRGSKKKTEPKPERKRGRPKGSKNRLKKMYNLRRK